jgi:hypothetical protein
MNKEIEKAIEILITEKKRQYDLLDSIPTKSRERAKDICNMIKACEFAITALEAQQADMWIPVSERLPNKAGTYICTVKWEDNSYGTYPVWWHNGIRTDRIWDLDGNNVNVIAWKTLDEPWKEEKP